MAERGTTPPAGHKDGLHILLVDDSRDACTVMQMLLELHGYKVQTAHTGRSALEAAETARPDVVLLDIGLPDTNGYEVCRQLRARDHLRSAMIIALSGRGEPEDRARSEAAGFDHHVLKPAEIDQLRSLFPQA